MGKIFVVAGELSGDKTGGWYLNRLKEEAAADVYAVGGSNLKSAGAKIYDDFNKLNIVGGVEIISKLGFIFRYLKELTNYIIDNDFDEVILVDFPGFNLILAKRLKKKNPNLKITYLSPPQLWVWGAWRVKTLKNYCDKIVVMYPSEAEWYKQRGVSAEFLGNPLCSDLESLGLNNSIDLMQKNQIAILPGSRKQEIIKLLPMFSKLIKKIKLLYPNLKIVFPLAQSLDQSFVELELRKVGLYNHGQDVEIIYDENEKRRALKKSILAITKPGTITLELALLEIPSVILYKASWITYVIAKILAHVEFMGLPNLFLDKPVFKEFIQGDCKLDLIFNEVKSLYESFLTDKKYYSKVKSDLKQICKKVCLK